MRRRPLSSRAARELSSLPQELARALDAARSLNPRLNAFTSIVSPEAAAASLAVAKGKGPLRGVAYAAKDIFCTRSLPTTAASRMLQDFTSPFDATVISRLNDAGAIMVGKTNMDEFGMGSANLNSHFGRTINPSTPDGLPEQSFDDLSCGARVAGGSSGGSAVAVAADLCRIALASDTGGSTRLPASYCGIVGLKPSYGLVSRWGMLAYASSLDCVGIMAKRVEDVETTLGVIAGFDAKDPTSVTSDARDRAAINHDVWRDRISSTSLKGLRVGVPLEYFPEQLSSEVIPALRKILRQLLALGATVSSVSLPSTPHALSAYYVIASAEASSNLGRYDGTRFGYRSRIDGKPVAGGDESRPALYAASRSEAFGPEVQKRILLGTHALSSELFDNYFLQAQRVRKLIQLEFDDVFRSPNPLSFKSVGNSDGVDVLLHPSAISTAPLVASALSPPSSTEGYVQDILNVPSSLAGLPALAVPAGRAENGWPVGAQIVGQWGSDSLVLQVGRALEGCNAP